MAAVVFYRVVQEGSNCLVFGATLLEHAPLRHT
jgi:hypothetical protein